MSCSSLRALQAIINQSIDDIEQVYTTKSTETSTSIVFPSLDKPLDASSLAETLFSHPVVLNARQKIIAATGQLTATVQDPATAIAEAALIHVVSSCLSVLEATNTAELLRDAGPTGMGAEQIAVSTGVTPSRITHALRLLATHHYINEPIENVFSLNRLSSVIDTGKPFDELKSQPEDKYSDTNGIAACVGLYTDEVFKASSYITDSWCHRKDPKDTTGDSPNLAPFSYAFRCPGMTLFDWWAGEGYDNDKEHISLSPSYRRERFGKAMQGNNAWGGSVLDAFDWTSLQPGSTLIDVGGGIGSTAMTLHKEFNKVNTNPHLHLIVQDRQEVVETGIEVWRKEMPHALDAGIIEFQAHDFFTPQPIKSASVFILRHIMHDWTDPLARTILSHLRAAAQPDTKLVIGDFVLPTALSSSSSSSSTSTSSVKSEAGRIDDVVVEGSMQVPYPLLQNGGKAGSLAYSYDIMMHAMLNAHERSLQEHVDLCASAGWKVIKVVMSNGNTQFGFITAVVGKR